MCRIAAVIMVVAAIAAVVAAVLLVRRAVEPAGRPSNAVSLPTTVVGGAATVLAMLPVREPGGTDDNLRDAFGAGWRDPHRNGCDARHDILRRDLTDVAVRDGTQCCVVGSGTLHDPSTGQTIAFVKGPDSADVQIDHVVPLALAWADGANTWTEDQRIAFANAPLNLMATFMAANRSKSDSDAANWLPPDATYACPYVARQIAVKAAYGMPVAPAERGAMEQVSASCPGQRLPERN